MSFSFRALAFALAAFVLVTADYLAQMSSPDYLDKLPALYREFTEAFDFEQMPPEKRPYHTYQELLEKTPGFWNNYVRPMLDFEAGGVHRYLTTAGQPNPYLQAVEANIAEIGASLGSLIDEANNPKLLLDFAAVDHLSSAALGMLINANKRIREKNGQLRLANIKPQIFEVFVITKLNKLFKILPNRAEALASFNQ